MRHALWIVVLVAACGRDGAEPAPTAAETKALKAQVLLPRDAQGLRAVTGPKGTQLRLDGNFQSAAVIRRGADGSLQTECFDEAHEAEAFMTGTPTARTAEVQ